MSFHTECSAKPASPPPLQRDAASKNRAALDGSTAQPLGRVLVLLVFEQAPDQLLARVERLFLLADRLQRLRRRHQLARLEIDQVRGHHQVFGRHLHRHALHHVEVFAVFLRDEGDGDVEDVQLVRLAEVQEQIERSLELGQGQAIGRAGGNLGAASLEGRRPAGHRMLVAHRLIAHTSPARQMPITMAMGYMTMLSRGNPSMGLSTSSNSMKEP